ncbi:MAG: hypothetical protein ACFE8L_01775 [Candidatus Hodarchaeota archaeon]
MERRNIIKKNQVEPQFNKKAILSEKLESLWEKSSDIRNSKDQKKKLVLKLETHGVENRKIQLKLESSNSQVNSNNYNLLSELLKGFFNSNGKLE